MADDATIAKTAVARIVPALDIGCLADPLKTSISCNWHGYCILWRPANWSPPNWPIWVRVGGICWARVGVSLTSYLPSEYDRRARFVPFVLVVSPAVLAACCWFEPFTFPQFGAAVLALAFVSVFAHLGRDGGKKIEPQLFEKWGGIPSVQLLRHRSTILARPTKDRYRARLKLLLPDLAFPSAVQEDADPAAADATYQACSDFLRTKTRDIQKYRVIFDENLNYGFRRNLRGLRPAGILLCSLGLIASCVALAVGSAGFKMATFPVIACAANFLMLSCWLFRFNDDWIRVPAFAYATRLLESCETLEPEPRKASAIQLS